jgi:organic hydroperoxide reductase OsmC/OhrA
MSPNIARKPIAPFPHHYQVSLEGRPDGDGVLECAPRPPIVGGPPPQFGGEHVVWSPEELLLSAAALCLMTTFQAIAGSKSLAGIGWRCSAEGVLDRTASGPAFTSIRIEVELSGRAEQEQLAVELLHLAERRCIIKNSLKVPVEVSVSFRNA